MTRDAAGPGCGSSPGVMPAGAVHEKAAGLGVTVNEYLTGALCYAFYLLQKQEAPRRPKPVKISVPINMRRFYPSQTLRNFALFVNPGIEPEYGDYSFEEIVQSRPPFHAAAAQ